jgi:membrane protease subunit HflK
VDRVHRFATAQIQSFNIGFQPETNRPPERTILWTVPHYQQENNFLVASRDVGGATNGTATDQTVPVSLLAVGIPVQYEITNIIEYAYNYADAGALLEELATREVVRYLVGVDLIEIMSTQRLEAGRELHSRIQAQANQLNLGVNVLMVGLQGIHPPTKVAEAFEKVVGAEQQKEAAILRAEGEAARIVPEARAAAFRDVNEAEASKVRIVSSAAAQAGQFTNQVVAFKAAPSVYPWRLYYEALTEGAASARKYIVTPTNIQDVIQLDLQDTTRPDLLDVPVGQSE